jgi:hypothetical protein
MELLIQAEKGDGYRAACEASELNRLARQGHEYTFFPTDVQRQLQQICKEHELTQGCKVITLHPSADSGFPHTRPGGLICMPGNTNPGEATQTLLHEACHISQRKEPAMWIGYAMKEGWWPVAESELPAKWLERVRINPDTMAEPFWSWQDYYVPLPLFANEQSPHLRQCDIRWFDRRNRVLHAEPPSSFLERYGAIGQPEHPFEVSAIELSIETKTREELLNILTY